MAEYGLESLEFFRALADDKLIGARCEDCGALTVPQRGICPKCFSSSMKVEEVEGKGKLAAYTVIYVPPTEMKNYGYGMKNPYASAVIELDEGGKVCGQLVGFDLSKPEEIKIGTPLVMEKIVRGEGEEEKVSSGFRAA